jgi:hypothetical protein
MINKKAAHRALRKKIAEENREEREGAKQSLRSAERLRLVGVHLHHAGHPYRLDSWAHTNANH